MRQAYLCVGGESQRGDGGSAPDFPDCSSEPTRISIFVRSICAHVLSTDIFTETSPFISVGIKSKCPQYIDIESASPDAAHLPCTHKEIVFTLGCSILPQKLSSWTKYRHTRHQRPITHTQTWRWDLARKSHFEPFGSHSEIHTCGLILLRQLQRVPLCESGTKCCHLKTPAHIWRPISGYGPPVTHETNRYNPHSGVYRPVTQKRLPSRQCLPTHASQSL